MSDSGKKKTFILGVSLVLGGCCLNNIFLENMIIGDRGCGPLLTLLQFVFIAILSFPDRLESSSSQSSPQSSSFFPALFGFRLKSTSCPVWWYVLLTTVFFTLSVLNNVAYDYEISQPLHMVFRSSSLAVSLALGFVFFSKRYSVWEVSGVIIVTCGIFVTTYADAQMAGKNSSTLSSTLVSTTMTTSSCGANGCTAAAMDLSLFRDIWNTWMPVMTWRKTLGVMILTLGLFLSGLLGLLQSWGYDRWKRRDEQEAMFYQHFFSIFYFAPLLKTLSEHAELWSSSAVFISLGTPALSMTWMWFNLWGNLITQYICIRGVYLLIANSGPLTATLVLTVRKFVSLVLSIVLFNNAWSSSHWLGTILVFGGAFVYGAGRQMYEFYFKEQDPAGLKKII